MDLRITRLAALTALGLAALACDGQGSQPVDAPSEGDTSVADPDSHTPDQDTHALDDLSDAGHDASPLPDVDLETASAGDAVLDTAPDLGPASCPSGLPCRLAQLGVAEGLEVIPQTTLHLDAGAEDLGPNTAYEWEVDQPNGSVSRFRPSASVAAPRFEANVAGTYTFRVKVTELDAPHRVAEAERVVFVNPRSALHIELLWTTPADPDEGDEGPEAGSDLDLHFAADGAASGFDGDGDGLEDPWFDWRLDVFWYNSAPQWESLDPSGPDDPRLDRDDTDGAGPENLNLDVPSEGRRYQVGVHYWADRGFGPSFATVRIYIYGVLDFQLADIELEPGDLWWVTELAWPPVEGEPNAVQRVCEGTTTACRTDAECGGARCGLRITPDYRPPGFPR